ncbi:MAG TPA: L-glutamate gamma-semialdehyde dehydrogenase [Bacteroidales bacterium]|jgi:1-pyrroline-5-carboxylate dehydrogenase|nr:L-glutamate gamma-semialdehyde dehydrogenase [Bacteroidales bacterium]HKM13052.1 L-glutamate gamma-semialdehyde dehydrogenase [Bacteroidales bacterium]HPB89432.1 L-glutamate gamma-semialdehyde dehydrogenase [Bacteroidales bacterium]HQP79687.1 L-glutamate gamma-semialdehyde dehydrogenase [Bacteroidales bacterium]
MKNAIFSFPLPANEPVKTYLKGSPEREALEAELKKQSSQVIEIPLIIGGKEVRTGNTGKVVMPHDHRHVLATYHKAGEKEVQMAIDAAMAAHKEWSELDWTVRATILLKIADLIAGKYRAVINAATMLGQSKNIYQAEIDAACELIDFLRYNAHFAGKLYGFQPKSAPGQINSVEYRALEGFVFALSPFNFTSIACNLNMSPILMGNVTVWKPATTAILSNYYLMKVFKEAGVPDGVINFLPGPGKVIGNVVFNSKYMAGVHFTGSNATFNTLWKQAADNLEKYISYPRLVGETGGKDFIFVHPSACVKEVATAAFCGAFEFQGQKCSAASRMYVPASLWPAILEGIKEQAVSIKMGDVCDPSNFVNAVIDEASFDNISSYIELARNSKDAKIVMGGKCDKSKGYFVHPTVIETTNPHFKSMVEEIFGPVLTVYVYKDAEIDKAVELCDNSTIYGLTGAVFGRDRIAVQKIADKLRYTAGNFYINDKPTGAVVGMQPFGGSRASGTNDKAGGEFNLIRWTIPRTIKETLVPSTDYRYSYMK